MKLNIQRGLDCSNQEMYSKFVKKLPYSVYMNHLIIDGCRLDSWVSLGDKFP